ncbi:hypothetical protein [Saccharopolyspora pogona]|uniref:hypothetical protein n=1 Tax=Saccharopolyspora pogona TaxID=333966 RepID=UPI001685F2CD|nr:hypothetical protein [Saccharopolyspora pogona]
MSGKAGTSDSGSFAKWTFDVSDRVTVGSCKPSVYIPNDSDRRNVGATAGHYSIFNSFEQGGANVVGVEDIKQVANRGKWVDLGEYAIDQGKLSVKLRNRGEDWAEPTARAPTSRPPRAAPPARPSDRSEAPPGRATRPGGASHRSDQSKTVTPWETGWRVPTFIALTGNSA